MAAADLFVTKAKLAIIDHDRFSVALSGGLTPLRTFEILAQKQMQKKISWNKTHVFWSDERCVQENNVLRNSLMAKKAFLDHVPVYAEQIHTVNSSLTPEESAEEYDKLLHSHFSQHHYFDFMMLGLGVDGHTASIFPDSMTIDEQKQWVISVKQPNQELQRITLTLPIINRSECVVFLVSGAEKAGILKDVLEPSHGKLNLPAQLVCPKYKNAEIYWLVDKAASSQLKSSLLAHRH